VIGAASPHPKGKMTLERRLIIALPIPRRAPSMVWNLCTQFDQIAELEAKPQDKKARLLMFSWLRSCAFAGGKERCGGPSRCPRCSQDARPKPDISEILGRKKSALYVDPKEGRLAVEECCGATRVRKSELDRFLSTLPTAKFAPPATVGAR
jgi:hypothetical protein